MQFKNKVTFKKTKKISGTLQVHLFSELMTGRKIFSLTELEIICSLTLIN